MDRKLNSLLPIALFLLIWELVGRLPSVPTYLFPPFSSVVVKLFTVKGLLLENIFFTLFRVTIGFVIGTASGITLGLLAGINEKVNQFMTPIASIIYPIPSIGWIPVLMIWFGISNSVPVIAIFICSFFPIFLNTVRGVKDIDQSIIYAAKTMGTSKTCLIRKIILPLALPNIFTGLKLESGMSIRTGVVAEMLAIPSGLGYLLMKGESLIDTQLIFVVLIVMGLISLVVDYTIRKVEVKLLTWKA